MRLVHKSIDVRPEIWRTLRLHAELSDVAVRDYLSWLIEQSQPVEGEGVARDQLDAVVLRNRQVRESMKQ